MDFGPSVSVARLRKVLNTACSVVAILSGVIICLAQSIAADDSTVLRAKPIVPAPLSDLLELPVPAPDARLTKENELKAAAQAYFMEGLIFEQYGQVERMIASYQNAFDLDPGNSLLAEKLALEYVRSGDVPAGIGVLKDAIKIDPGNARLHLLTATLYARSLKKFDQAKEFIDNALKLEPTSTDNYEVLLGIYLATENQSAARQTLEEIIELDVTDPAFWLGCGELAARILIQSNPDVSGQDMQLVNLFYDRAVQLTAEDPSQLMRIGEYFLITRQTNKAIGVLAKAVSSLPEDSVIWLPVHSLMARAYLLEGSRERAISTLKRILEVNPLQRETYELLGSIYQESGDLKNALAQFEQAILIDPGLPINYLRAADIYVNLEQPGRAVEILQEARARITNIPQLTYSLAIAYGQEHRYQLAVNTFELALDEAKFLGEDIATAAFYFNFGIIADKAGEYYTAKQCFLKVIELEPEKAAPALNYLGYMMVLKRDDLDQAEVYIQQALELEPENGAYVDSLGWLYYQRGEYSEALELLLRAEQLIDQNEPMNFEIFDHIGDTYARLENLPKAVEYWEKALKLAPDEQAIATKIDEASPKVTSQTTTSTGSFAD